MAFTDTTGTKYNKIILVRVQHGEHNTSPTDLGSGLYKYSADRPTHKVTRNGVSLTEVTSTPTNNDEFYHDEATNEVTVKLASAPNSTSNVIIIYTYLFYTNERARALAETPTSAISTSNPRRDWEPKVANVPSFIQSIKNNLSGVLSTSGSSIDIINTDNSINSLVSLNNSFGNKLVDIWIALDDDTNIEKIYTGIITGVRITDTIATFNMTDITSRLDSLAFMGDSEDEAIHLLSSNSTLDPISDQTPRIFYIGPSTRFTPINDASITGISDAQRPIKQSLEQAVCTDRSDLVSGTVNREWDLGRSFAGPADAVSTISSIVAGGSGNDYLTFTPGTTTGARFTVGQCITITGYNERRVVKVASNGDVSTTWESGDATPAVSTAVTGHKITIYIQGVNDNGRLTMLLSTDINSVTNTATSGGNISTKIILDDDFEATTSDFGADKLDPEVHTVRFIATYEVDDETNAPISHENVLEAILERAGMVGAVGLPSFVDSSTVTTDLQFSIPFFDQPDYSNYRIYIERLLLSTNGLLYTGVDQVIYKNILEPTTQVNTVGTNDTLKGSRAMNVNYRDISYVTTGFNPHSPVSESGTSSNKHRYLHDSDNATRFRHIAVELDTDVAALRSKINRNRKIDYSHDTFAQDLDSSPGDSVTLEHDLTDNPTGTTDVFITQINKSTKSTKIRSSDILDD